MRDSLDVPLTKWLLCIWAFMGYGGKQKGCSDGMSSLRWNLAERRRLLMCMIQWCNSFRISRFWVRYWNYAAERKETIRKVVKIRECFRSQKEIKLENYNSLVKLIKMSRKIKEISIFQILFLQMTNQWLRN